MNDWRDFTAMDIQVALTSTKYVVSDEKVRNIDSPVCVAEMNLKVLGLVFNYHQNPKELDQFIFLCVKEMLEEVDVDVEKRTIIVGNKTCPLVIFTARPLGVSIFEDSFFLRWSAYKMMLFEMHFFVDENTTVALNAVYDGHNKKWTEPKKSLNPNIRVLDFPNQN
jgi:hypothetical protein